MRSFAFAAIAAFAAAAEEQENLYHTYGPHYGGVYGAHYGDHAVYTSEHADYGVEPWESHVPIHAVHEEVAHVGPVYHEEKFHHYAAPYHYSDSYYHAPVEEYHTAAYHVPYHHGMHHFAPSAHLERHYEGYHLPAHHKSTYYIAPEHTAYEVAHSHDVVTAAMPHATTTTTTTTYGDDYGYAGVHPYAADTYHSVDVVGAHPYGAYGDYGYGAHAAYDVAPAVHEVHETYAAPVVHEVHDTYVAPSVPAAYAAHHDIDRQYTYGAGLRDTFVADHQPHDFGATTYAGEHGYGYYGPEHHVYEDVHDLHYEPYQKSTHEKKKEATPVLGLDASKPAKKEAKKEAKKNESDNVWRDYRAEPTTYQGQTTYHSFRNESEEPVQNNEEENFYQDYRHEPQKKTYSRYQWLETQNNGGTTGFLQ